MEKSSNKRILIIEDDRFISEMYARTLKKEGFEVEEVITGPDGITKANEGNWDYILLDIMLPDKTGVEVIEELRSSPNKSVAESKIIVMTNFEQDDATRQDMEQLADGYLIKAEITPRRLADIIQDMEKEQAAGIAPAGEPEEKSAEPSSESSSETPESIAPKPPGEEVKESEETS